MNCKKCESRTCPARGKDMEQPNCDGLNAFGITFDKQDVIQCPVTKAKPTNADRIRAMSDIDLDVSRVFALRKGYWQAVDVGLHTSFQSAIKAELDYLQQEATT